MDDFLEVKMDDLNKNKEAKLYIEDKKLFFGKKKRYIDDILRNSKYEGKMANSANKWLWKPKQSAAANLGGGSVSGYVSK
jgi:hypothetical protein